MYSPFFRRQSCWSRIFGIAKFIKFELKRPVCCNSAVTIKKNAITGGGLCIPFSLSILGLWSKDEETPEDKLVTIIKRSVLCIQREQYDKAEQMLHLALRMAQDLQSGDGITYVYDVMANLAMEREQYKKAEKLFIEVMKRLMEEGYTEDNPKILHISSKLAHIAQLQGDLNKSMLGFTWTMKKVEECAEKMPDDVDVRELLGLTQYWFGQLHMKQNNYEEARKHFKCAYECFIKIHGSMDEECITILNNLSVACVKLDKLSEATFYLKEALKLVRNTNDSLQEGVLQANLGLIFLKQGLLDEAKHICTQAWRFGTSKKDSASIEQAEYCLNEIKTYEMKC